MPTHRSSRNAPIALMAVLAWFACGATASAGETVLGHLELRWGDPPAAHAEHRPHKFTATLVTARGERIALDPAQARRAAGDLYALANRPVAVAFSHAPSAAKSAATRRAIEAIVPADDIAGQREHVAAGKAGAVAKDITGARRWVTIACKFSDIATEQKTVAFFQGQYGEAPGQVGHYWREVSYGKTNVQGSTAAGWFTLPHPRDHYITEDAEGEPDADLNALFADCTAAATATVDFSDVFGINMMFNGELDDYAWGGGRCTTLDGVNRCWPSTWNPPWAFNNLAPFAHEMGHGYGLPHSDNSDGDDDPYDNPWDVMSDSWRNAVQDGTYGTRPKHVNMLQRERLGWVDAARKRVVMANQGIVQVALDFAHRTGSTNTQLLVLAMPTQEDPYRTTIYSVEARQRSGDYEAQLAGDAVIIHAMTDYGMAYSQDADAPPADVANNEGSMFKVGETWTSPDEHFSVRVASQSAAGFVVVVTSGKPRVTGGNLPARRR